MADWSPQSENLRVRLADATRRSGQPGPVEFLFRRTQDGRVVSHAGLGDIANATETAFHELQAAGLITVLGTPTQHEVQFYFKEPPKVASELLGRVERLREILVSRATGGSGFADDDEYRNLRADLRLDGETGPRLPEWIKNVRDLLPLYQLSYSRAPAPCYPTGP